MIEVRDLWKSYGGFHALLGINFTVNRGEIVGFCGPNGAGKTTCMKILTGYMLPSPTTRGGGGPRVHAFRMPAPGRVAGIAGVGKAIETRRMIGYLPENTPLYADMTVREYLRFCADLRRMSGRLTQARNRQL